MQIIPRRGSPSVLRLARAESQAQANCASAAAGDDLLTDSLAVLGLADDSEEVIVEMQW